MRAERPRFFRARIVRGCPPIVGDGRARNPAAIIPSPATPYDCLLRIRFTSLNLVRIRTQDKLAIALPQAYLWRITDRGFRPQVSVAERALRSRLNGEERQVPRRRQSIARVPFDQ